MQFDKIHNVSFNQLQVLLTARLTMIVLCTHGLFLPISRRISRQYNRDLSMLKFMKYIEKNQTEIFNLIPLRIFDNNLSATENADLKLIRYCAYDVRKRVNISQLCKNVFLS
jgi:hypothetical protein